MIPGDTQREWILKIQILKIHRFLKYTGYFMIPGDTQREWADAGEPLSRSAQKDIPHILRGL